MRRILVVFAAFALSILGVSGVGAQGGPNPSSSGPSEKRIAFVVGNESYAAGALPTAANDAGLIAQTLQAAGFDVVGARDLDAETLRQSYADFLKRVTNAGPGAVAFVYLSGYGLQYGSDNYYVPIGASVAGGPDIPIETIRLSDLTGPLASLNLKARFLVFDTSYQPPFKLEGAAMAGFSLVDALPGTLIAYNAAPGTIAPIGKGNYGAYAQSLAAELREGGLPPDEIFDRVRLRVSTESKGVEVPWDTSKMDAGFHFFERGPGASAPAATTQQVADLTGKPLKDMPVAQAYSAAVARDTVDSYSDFGRSFGGDPLAKRTRVLLAARREAVTWRRTVTVDTPAAYWSYLSRYPRGPHAEDARLRLSQLSVPPMPPGDYEAIAYDVPPPPPEELPFLDAPVVYLGAPAYDFPPPPPPPDYWLPPVPVAFLDLPPPPPPLGLFFLPVPAFVPLAAYYDPPPFVVFPANNYFYGGGRGGPGGNAFINNRANGIHDSFPGGGPRGAGAPGGPATSGVVLPAAAQQRAETLQRRGITTPAQLNAARQQPGGIGGGVGAGNALPGQRGTAGGLPGARPAAGAVEGPRSRAGAAGAGAAGAAGAAAVERAERGRPGAPGAAGNRPDARTATAPRPTAATQRAERQQKLEQRRAGAASRAATTRQAPAPRAQVRAPGPRPGPSPRPGAGPRPGGFAAGPRPGGPPAGPRPAFAPGPRPGGPPGGFAGPRPGGPPPGPRPGGPPAVARPAPAVARPAPAGARPAPAAARPAPAAARPAPGGRPPR